MEDISIYSDGSYTPKFPDLSGWAYVIINNDEQIIHHENGNVKCESRNIDGECIAIINALKYINNNLTTFHNNNIINIYYDYIGLEKWAKHEWKTNKNVSITFQKQYDELNKKINKKINWIKVKSHSGNKWNDYVDKLCQLN